LKTNKVFHLCSAAIQLMIPDFNREVLLKTSLLCWNLIFIVPTADLKWMLLFISRCNYYIKSFISFWYSYTRRTKTIWWECIYRSCAKWVDLGIMNVSSSAESI